MQMCNYCVISHPLETPAHICIFFSASYICTQRRRFSGCMWGCCSVFAGTDSRQVYSRTDCWRCMCPTPLRAFLSQGGHVTDHPSWPEGRLLCCWHWEIDLQTPWTLPWSWPALHWPAGPERQSNPKTTLSTNHSARVVITGTYLITVNPVRLATAHFSDHWLYNLKPIIEISKMLPRVQSWTVTGWASANFLLRFPCSKQML